MGQRSLTLLQDVRQNQPGEIQQPEDFTDAMDADLKKRMQKANLPANSMDDIQKFFDDDENGALLATHVIRLGNDMAAFPRQTIGLVAHRLLATDKKVRWPPYHR